MGTQQPHTHNVPSMQHRSVGQFIKDEIAGPLGVEIYVGVPPSERRRLTDMHSWPASYMLTNAVPHIILPRAVSRLVFGDAALTTWPGAMHERDIATLVRDLLATALTCLCGRRRQAGGVLTHVPVWTPARCRVCTVLTGCEGTAVHEGCAVVCGWSGHAYPVPQARVPQRQHGDHRRRHGSRRQRVGGWRVIAWCQLTVTGTAASRKDCVLRGANTALLVCLYVVCTVCDLPGEPCSGPAARREAPG